MADNPFQSALNPRSQGAGLWDLRMMSAANRMETPFERGMRGPGHGGVSGNPMFSAMAGMANEPDYSQFTYDPVMRQRAIAAGVSPLEANQVQQNVLLPNSGFFGRHPNLSRALEGGLFAAAATPSSGGVASAGENISHAIEGMIGGERMRQGLYRQQFARPFEAAGALEQLSDMKQNRELRAAEIKHYQDESDIQRQRVNEQQLNDANRINATRPVPVEGGVYEYNPGQQGPPTNVAHPWDSAPSKGGWQFMPGAGKGRGLEGDLDIGTREQLRIAGVDPNGATSSQLAAANKKAQAQAVARVGAGAGARDSAEQPYKNLQAARQEHESMIKGLQAKMLKADDPKHQDQIREEYYNDWTSSAMQAAASGQKAPDFKPPTSADIAARISHNNADIQSQIDAQNASFAQQYPQALETPGRKSSSPKTGSVVGTKDNPHVLQ